MVTAVRKRRNKGPTASAYGFLQAAFDHFNKRLWSGNLPGCLITLTNKARAMGYFAPNRYGKLDPECQTAEPEIDEIALNPAYFIGHPAQEAMQTLVHEMCHLWQQRCGTPPRRGYHDKEWAAEMRRVGLMPSSTGKPGGKQTGQNIADYAIEGGLFLVAFGEFMDSHETELYADLGRQLQVETEQEKPKSKVKFTCPKCQQNAWGKPDLNILCGDCECRMESEDSDE